MDYWVECISEAFDDVGIVATEEQIKTVASWVDGAHDNYGQAHGYDCIPSPVSLENEQLKADLKKERDKRGCPECNGSGVNVSHGPAHSAITQCWKCRGEGKV